MGADEMKVKLPELDRAFHNTVGGLTVVKDAIEQEGCDDGHLMGLEIMLQLS